MIFKQKHTWAIVFQVLFILLLLADFYFSLLHTSGTKSGHHSGKGLDKHLVVYFLLSFLLSMALLLRDKCRCSLLVGVLSLLLLSAAIEILQPYFGRTASWYDLGANALGLLIGAFIADRIIQLIQKRL